MEARAIGVGTIAFACLLSAFCSLRAQADSIGTAIKAHERKAANRYRTYLEIPERRTEGVRGLLKMGAAAIDALILGAKHPDAKIACINMQILGELGELALPAAATLKALAKSEDTIISNAAGWADIRINRTGALLIVEFQSGRIVSLPAAGDPIVVLKDIPNAFDVERVTGGNYLVAQYQQKQVVEYTPDGKEVWSYKDLKSPLDADRLANGNTLICDSAGNKVIEVDRTGKVVWSYEKCKKPYDADRLPNGNTLITEYPKGVVEVDASGKVIWEYRGKEPVGADRLPNGNTLITNSQSPEVLEVDSAGKTVMQLRDLTRPVESRRLGNGHTVVAEQNRVRVFDAAGKAVRSIALTDQPGTVHVY
tara:strand:+ start:1360 stop:2457 length:1098 start_codon:yes stop_codon:yes gene_type:complete